MQIKNILYDAAASAETPSSLEHPAFKMSGWKYNSTHSQRPLYVVSFMLQQFYPRGTSLISIGLCTSGPWCLSKPGGGKCLLPLSRDCVILSPHILVTKLAKLSLILYLFLLSSSSSSSSPTSWPLLVVVLVALNAIIWSIFYICLTVHYW